MTDTTPGPPPVQGITFELKITATGEVRNAEGDLLEEVTINGGTAPTFTDADGNPIGTPTDRGTLLVTAAELDTISAILEGAEQ